LNKGVGIAIARFFDLKHLLKVFHSKRILEIAQLGSLYV